jgi:hypothetical protein
MFIWFLSSILLAQSSSVTALAEPEPTTLLAVTSVARGAPLADQLGAACAQGAVQGGLLQSLAELRAPQAGAFWVACFSPPLSAPNWRRFVVDDPAKAANVTHQIAQDLSAPAVRLYWKSANETQLDTVASENPVLLGPLLTLELSTQEQSQLRSTRLLVNGIEATAATWSAGLTNTTDTVQFEIASEDVLGNIGTTQFGPIKFDAIAPALAFKVLNSPPDAEPGQVGKPPYVLALNGTDASGVVQLSAGACRGQGSMQCTLATAQTTLHGVDAVGNSATLEIALHVDDQGPSFLVDATPIVAKRLLKLGDSIALSASDAAGLSETCARFGGRCRSLPARYRAVQTGRFKIYLVARDAFGNQSKQSLAVEVRR